ncbi:MAG: hypothetical protein E7632_02730 [Ruminococcaceae bacterium]|nr:hypothetical protein [Oscillospiraceae bacterium]
MKITCPYCFEEFEDHQVHFRMETCFGEGELNDLGLPLDEIEHMDNSPEKEALLAQMAERQPFETGQSSRYQQFWSVYGATSEKYTDFDRRVYRCASYELPVIDPLNAPEHSLRAPDGSRDVLIRDRKSGMVTAVIDRFGHETKRRVCPHCHNPLPQSYGQHEVKFISVIGVSGSGKTIYISQMLKYMQKYASYAGMAAFPLSHAESDFVNDNPVIQGHPLAPSNMSGRLSQPMFYDLMYKDEKKGNVTNTIVLFDIAGEDCITPEGMQRFGRFVRNSHGIIFLVDPRQLGLIGMTGQVDAPPTQVIDAIHHIWNSAVTIPMAVCVPKSDMFSLPETHPNDIIHSDITVEDGMRFNATQYNHIVMPLKNLIQNADGLPLLNALKMNFPNHNLFAFSSIGCSVEKRDIDGLERSVPVGPTFPRRIAEPLLWMFFKFGYIRSDVKIRLPFRREFPEMITDYENASFFQKLTKKYPKRPLNESEKQVYDYEQRCFTIPADSAQ